MLVRNKLPAVLMRAGTSKGLFLKSSDLPADKSEWGPILLSAMGSPDPFGRQLNGVGGGSSTTSKIAIVGPSELPSVDVDYTFVAAPIGGKVLDFTGNCGNMASGVGPFAVEEGIVRTGVRNGSVTISIRNTNTGIIMRATFAVQNGLPVEDGDCFIDGVSQSGSPIRLDFLNPAGAMTGKLLPTGNPIDTLVLPPTSPHKAIQASMIDAANPFVFVCASDLGLIGNESPAQLVPHTQTLMHIREAAAVAMGLASDPSTAALTAGTPKIAIVGMPAPYTTTSGRIVDTSEMDIQVRPFSMGAPHPSLQMTGAVCLAAACAVPGSIPFRLLQAARMATSAASQGAPLRFAHASGVIETDSQVEMSGTGEVHVVSGSVYRTARRLFEGKVAYLTEAWPVTKVPRAVASIYSNGHRTDANVTVERRIEIAT